MTESKPTADSDFDPLSVTGPDPILLKYYTAISVLSGPGLPFVFLPLYFKYVTLEYKFDADGVSMRWGILFRREIHLTYRRIQDIHLTRNLIQRWMGLATVAIQTASGSSGPEMSIEGIPQAEALRDFLYSNMRGARGLSDPSLAATTKNSAASSDASGPDESLQLLREIRDALKSQSVAKADATSEGTSG